MLPLTRNIFRQTATSFNNTTKRWKQVSYYIQIKWRSFALCELLEILHLSINKIMILRSIITAVVNDRVDKGWSMGARFFLYVANDAVFIQLKVMWFFFSLEKISLLFYFKACFVTSQIKSTLSDQICRDMKWVVHDSGQLDLSFGIICVNL